MEPNRQHTVIWQPWLRPRTTWVVPACGSRSKTARDAFWIVSLARVKFVSLVLSLADSRVFPVSFRERPPATRVDRPYFSRCPAIFLWRGVNVTPSFIAVNYAKSCASTYTDPYVSYKLFEDSVCNVHFECHLLWSSAGWFFYICHKCLCPPLTRFHRLRISIPLEECINSQGENNGLFSPLDASRLYALVCRPTCAKRSSNRQRARPVKTDQL